MTHIIQCTHPNIFIELDFSPEECKAFLCDEKEYWNDVLDVDISYAVRNYWFFVFFLNFVFSLLFFQVPTILPYLTLDKTMIEVHGKLRQRFFIECLQFHLKNSMNEKYNHWYTVHKTFYSLCDTFKNNHTTQYVIIQ